MHGDALLREILEELDWIEAADRHERLLRLRWLGTKPISMSNRFALRQDRSGHVISFDQHGNHLHPLGWTVAGKRALSYRALQQKRPSLWARLRNALTGLCLSAKPQVHAAKVMNTK